MSVVRCTPFCNPCNKGYKHHELLTTLLNTNTNNTTEEHEHDQLAKAVRKYEGARWDKNGVIMDKNEEFRFPMLHWACVLGKPRTVRWLLDNGFCPTVQCRDTKETAVHRGLITLPDFSAINNNSLALFTKILSSLKDCLGIGDHRQDTPLHVAAKLMVRNKSFNLYEEILVKMVAVVQTMSEKEQSDILNALNSTGDTPLHVLAASNKCYHAMQVLMDAGADSFLVNKLSISPLDVAIQNKTGRVVLLLKKALVEGYKKSIQPNVPINGNTQNQEIKVRRSERRSINLITFNQFYEAENSSPESLAETESLEEEEQNACATPTGPNNIQKSTIQQRSTGESWYDVTQNKRTLHEEAEFPIVVVKEEVPTENNICQCSEECSTRIESEEEELPRTEEPSIRDESDVPFLHVMKEAGVLSNLNDVITKTKEDHLSRMKAVEKSLKETVEELGKRNEKEKSIQQHIDNRKKELTTLTSQLHNFKNGTNYMDRKRKLLEDENVNLEKKILCCETLLKTVPKDSTY